MDLVRNEQEVNIVDRPLPSVFFNHTDVFPPDHSFIDIKIFHRKYDKIYFFKQKV